MALVTNHDDLQACIVMALRLDMDLAHKRASRIDKNHLAPRSLGRHSLRHTMRRKDNRAIIGAIFKFLDKNSAFGAQIVDNIFVVHNLVAHIDRRAPLIDCNLDNLDGAVDPRTKAARGGKNNFERWFFHRRAPLSPELSDAPAQVQTYGQKKGAASKDNRAPLWPKT
jgi:hypothetical protein